MLSLPPPRSRRGGWCIVEWIQGHKYMDLWMGKNQSRERLAVVTLLSICAAPRATAAAISSSTRDHLSVGEKDHQIDIYTPHHSSSSLYSSLIVSRSLSASYSSTYTYSLDEGSNQKVSRILLTTTHTPTTRSRLLPPPCSSVSYPLRPPHSPPLPPSSSHSPSPRHLTRESSHCSRLTPARARSPSRQISSHTAVSVSRRTLSAPTFF